MTLTIITFLFLFLVCSLGSPITNTPQPLVVWHGLGDTYASPGIQQFISLVKDIYPGIFIHSVYMDEDEKKDRRAGYYGNINEQIQFAAEQLVAIPQLQQGFDAIGFSQGGQFLRAYVERYNKPPVNNLITFGSQHMGISDIPQCDAYDFLCQVARRVVKSAVYGEWAQENIVQAQYFRDPSNYATYLDASRFLASINNEVVGSRNATYADRLTLLNKLILVMFQEDKTVVPKESSWFGSEPIEEENPYGKQEIMSASKTIVPMRMQPLYKEDWIGLRRLDEKGGVVMESCPGRHMNISGCWERLVRSWVGRR